MDTISNISKGPAAPSLAAVDMGSQIDIFNLIATEGPIPCLTGFSVGLTFTLWSQACQYNQISCLFVGWTSNEFVEVSWINFPLWKRLEQRKVVKRRKSSSECVSIKCDDAKELRRGRNKSGVKQKAASSRSGRAAAAAVRGGSKRRHGWRASDTIARLNPHPAAGHTTFPFSPTAMQLCVVSALFFMGERCSGET